MLSEAAPARTGCTATRDQTSSTAGPAQISSSAVRAPTGIAVGPEGTPSSFAGESEPRAIVNSESAWVS